jgi:uncharacterized alpha-E superfamily protein
VRDRLSADTWRIIGDIETLQASLADHPPRVLSQALDELDPLVTSLVAFSGLTQENMTHNEGWHFLETGRRLERGTTIASLLRSTLVPVAGEADENMLIEAVLGVTDSTITYRRRYRGGTRVGALLDLVFQDEGNPRALAYQLAMLGRLVTELPRGDLAVGRTPAEKLALKSLTDIRLAEINQLIQVEENGQRRGHLAERLADLNLQLAAMSDAITAQYFRHEEQPHSLLSRVCRGARMRYQGPARDPLRLCRSGLALSQHRAPQADRHPHPALSERQSARRSLAGGQPRARGFLRQSGQLFLDPAGTSRAGGHGSERDRDHARAHTAPLSAPRPGNWRSSGSMIAATDS